MLRGNPPPQHPCFSFSFYIFSFTFQKISENFGGGGGLNPLNPPFKYALLKCVNGYPSPTPFIFFSVSTSVVPLFFKINLFFFWKGGGVDEPSPLKYALSRKTYLLYKIIIYITVANPGGGARGPGPLPLEMLKV